MLAAARFIGASQSDLTRRPEMNLKAMAVVAGAVVASTASGDAVQWRVQDGGNGHWYRFNPTHASWDSARTAAILQGGGLACIGSAAENAFARSLVPVGDAGYIGAIRTSNGWQWVSGEVWSFTNWNPGEPNGSTPGEVVWVERDSGGWNDHAQIFDLQGSLFEWSADCNNDGIVDYGQCRDGSLADFNSNNIPDCCEQGAPCLLGATPFEWRIADGGNGHWYSVVTTKADISWNAAQTACESRGGHLATLTSAAEDDFVWPLARQLALWVVVNGPGWSGAKGPWLGLHQAPGSPTDAGWSWVTGEPFSWAHSSFMPNDGCSVSEDSLNYIGDVPSSRIWNDFPGDVPCDIWGFPRSYVIEWSSDCNNDGIVDYGQILRGELADTNADGIPNICEPCIGDIVQDGLVNGIDLAAVLNNWGTTGGVIDADVNNDGIVDGSDLSIVLNGWGACP